MALCRIPYMVAVPGELAVAKVAATMCIRRDRNLQETKPVPYGGKMRVATMHAVQHSACQVAALKVSFSAETKPFR